MSTDAPPKVGRAADPIGFETLRRALEGLGDEMAIVLARSAFSPLLRNALDFSTALLNTRCEVIAQGRTSPLHLISIIEAAQAVQRKFERFEPGDVFIVNDPYEGGSHLPDIFLVSPLFVDSVLFGFVGAEAHHVDVGGSIPGSNSSESTEIYQEGLRIPPSHLLRGGRRNETLFDLIERNTRFPEILMGDLQAQLSALRAGEALFLDIVERFGLDRVSAYVEEIFDYAETLARTEIATWPDGVYRFTDWIDDDGRGSDPIPICVEVRVIGDELAIDYSGTGAQVASAINTPGSFTRAVAMVAVRCLLAGEIPHNSGYLRPISVTVPEGTVLNARSPAAVSARALSAFRAFDATMGCLAQIVPQRAMAATEGGNALITFWGTDGDGRPYVVTDMHFGAWGGRSDRDGVDGICSPLVAVTNTPVEVIERETPLRVTRYEFVADSCGAGRFRGGLAVERAYRLEAGGGFVQVRSDRASIAPYGLAGGKAGATTRNVLRRDGAEEELPAKHTTPLAAGDEYVSVLAGAGGWGDPLERDPQLVWRDVRNEKMTSGFALAEFGVVVGSGGVDEPATRRARAQRRPANGERR
jgi:N-methylhydantoinase B